MCIPCFKARDTPSAHRVMARVQDVTIPTRFILTLGHFIVTVLALFHKQANINSAFGSNPAQADLDAADSEVTGILVVSIVMFVINFAGLVGGFTMFNDQMNCFQIIAHFVGGIGVAWYIVDNWRFRMIWPFFVFCSLVPAVAEIISFIGMVFLKRSKY